MTNTGTWNSNIVIGLLFFFLLPMFLFFIKQIIMSMTPPQSVIDIEIVPEYTYEDVKRTALRQAAEGDSAAREWVRKNIYEPKIQKQRLQISPISFTTNQNVIDDAVSALVALKMKKREAVAKVTALAAQKKYSNVNDLLTDSLRK